MAILSFKKRFAGKVRNGSKRQTIRAFRKYPIRPGETLYLYTALRTKFAKKLREVECKSVDEITIYFNTRKMEGIQIKRRFVKDLNAFAVMDGFLNWSDMRDFWIEHHTNRTGIFKGILITW